MGSKHLNYYSESLGGVFKIFDQSIRSEHRKYQASLTCETISRSIRLQRAEEASSSHPPQRKTRTNKQLVGLTKDIDRREAAGNYSDAICNRWRCYDENCNHYKQHCWVGSHQPDRIPQINLPPDGLPTDAYGIFSLFFGDAIPDVIAQNTYKYARIREAELERKHPSRHLKKPWEDTTVGELKGYLGMLIYMSLCHLPKRAAYWNTNLHKPVHEAVTMHISRNRFDELEASLHISDPAIDDDCFSKLEPLNSHLLSMTTTLWTPGYRLAMDEYMTRFTGRANEKHTIPSKPIPTGIKGWAVADLGYILYWFWHARGKGPQGV